jgi:2-iminobutanoate/2-iminopropanoate deaminase
MKKIINTKAAPAPIGPYSQAVQAGPFLFCSGQVAINPKSGALVLDTLENETHQVMKNVGELLKAAGYGFGDVIKTTIFLSDMDFFSRVNEVYGSYFKSDFPARETVAVRELPKSVNVEISVTAYR